MYIKKCMTVLYLKIIIPKLQYVRCNVGKKVHSAELAK